MSLDATLTTLPNDLSGGNDDTLEGSLSPWLVLNSVGKSSFQPQCLSDSNGKLVIGRKNACSIQFKDMRVSSSHLEIRYTDRSVVECRDCSNNGTFVNGKRLTRNAWHTLHNLDLVTLVTAEPSLCGAFLVSMKESLPVSDTAKNTSPKDSSQPGESSIGAIADALLCPICQEIMYNPTVAMPCCHSFCGGCLSPWFKDGKPCPMCRASVTRLQRNVGLSAVLDSFLEQQPHHVRPIADRRRLDGEDILHAGPVSTDDQSDDIRYQCAACTETSPLFPSFQCPESYPTHATCAHCDALVPLDPTIPTSCQLCGLVDCRLFWPHMGARNQSTNDRLGALKTLEQYISSGMMKKCLRNARDGRLSHVMSFLIPLMNSWEISKFTRYLSTPHGQATYPSATSVTHSSSSQSLPRSSAGSSGLDPTDDASDDRHSNDNDDDNSNNSSDSENSSSAAQNPATEAQWTSVDDRLSRLLRDNTLSLQVENRQRRQLTLIVQRERRSEFVVQMDQASAMPDSYLQQVGNQPRPLTLESACCLTCSEVIGHILLYKIMEEAQATTPSTLPRCWYGYKCRTQWHNSRHRQQKSHVCESTR